MYTYDNNIYIINRLTSLEFAHLLGLYHSFDACKSGGECIKTDGDASIMSYVSPPDKGFSPVDIEWLRRVYGPPKSQSGPSYQLDMINTRENYTTLLLSIFIIVLVVIILILY